MQSPMNEKGSYAGSSMQSPGLPYTPPANTAAMGAQYQNELLARCARGEHDPKTKYGMCGIITAIACFPCGLICLFTDSEKRCARCGELTGKK